MTITESRPSELILIKLEFVKPFEATSTAVTWSMSGENNFIARAVCLFMDVDKTVGGDFEKGLAQMKSVVEAATRH